MRLLPFALPTLLVPLCAQPWNYLKSVEAPSHFKQQLCLLQEIPPLIQQDKQKKPDILSQPNLPNSCCEDKRVRVHALAWKFLENRQEINMINEMYWNVYLPFIIYTSDVEKAGVVRTNATVV